VTTHTYEVENHIYIAVRHMEIHVKSNKKCSSIVCLKKYICNMQNDGPSDNEGSVYGLAISLVFQL